jgi:hypothetical protein
VGLFILLHCQIFFDEWHGSLVLGAKNRMNLSHVQLILCQFIDKKPELFQDKLLH